MNAYERSIIHLNVADFAVAVERAIDCRLKDRPVIIAPEGAARAAVYDMSEEAYCNGIRKGMALRRAVRLCRDARLLPPHPDRYEHAMRSLLKQTERTTGICFWTSPAPPAFSALRRMSPGGCGGR